MHRLTPSIIAAFLFFGLSACSDGLPPESEAPLQSNLRLVYEVTRTQGDKSLNDIYKLEFTKKSDGDFEYVRSGSSDVSSMHEIDRFSVDSFFMYDDVSELQVESYRLWVDPKKLADNDMAGKREVSEVQWKGDNVYLLQGYGMSLYYEKTTGILVGAEQQTTKTKVSVHLSEQENF